MKAQEKSRNHRSMTNLQRQPANGKYQDDDGDQFDDPLLGLHGFYVHSGPTKRLLKGEIG